MNNVTRVVLWVQGILTNLLFSKLLRSCRVVSMRVVRQHAFSLQKQLSVVGIIQCLLTLSYFQRCWQIQCPVWMLCCKRGTDDTVWQADAVQLKDTARRRNKTARHWGVFSHLRQGLIWHGWILVNRLCGYEKGSQIWTNHDTGQERQHQQTDL